MTVEEEKEAKEAEVGGEEETSAEDSWWSGDGGRSAGGDEQGEHEADRACEGVGTGVGVLLGLPRLLVVGALRVGVCDAHRPSLVSHAWFCRSEGDRSAATKKHCGKDVNGRSRE